MKSVACKIFNRILYPLFFTIYFLSWYFNCSLIVNCFITRVFSYFYCNFFGLIFLFLWWKFTYHDRSQWFDLDLHTQICEGHPWGCPQCRLWWLWRKCRAEDDRLPSPRTSSLHESTRENHEKFIRWRNVFAKLCEIFSENLSSHLQRHWNVSIWRSNWKCCLHRRFS